MGCRTNARYAQSCSHPWPPRLAVFDPSPRIICRLARLVPLPATQQPVAHHQPAGGLEENQIVCHRIYSFSGSFGRPVNFSMQMEQGAAQHSPKKTGAFGGKFSGVGTVFSGVTITRGIDQARKCKAPKVRGFGASIFASIP